MFGNNAKMVIEDFSFSSQMKSPFCSATLYVEKVEDCLDIFPIGAEQIILDAFKLLYLGDYLIVSVSIKELENGTSTATC